MWLLGMYCLGLFYVWVYSTLATELSRIQPEYQWILILVVPVVREVSVWTFHKASHNAAGESLPTKMTLNCYYETRYVVFVAIFLGSIATPESSYTLIAADFLTNLYRGLMIVKKSKAGENG